MLANVNLEILKATESDFLNSFQLLYMIKIIKGAEKRNRNIVRATHICKFTFP